MESIKLDELLPDVNHVTLFAKTANQLLDSFCEQTNRELRENVESLSGTNSVPRRQVIVYQFNEEGQDIRDYVAHELFKKFTASGYTVSYYQVDNGLRFVVVFG